MKSVIFNTQEVIATLEGRKSQFRLCLNPQPVLSPDKSFWEFKGVRWAGENSAYAKNMGKEALPEIPDLCPYQLRDEIFVKEAFNIFAGNIGYKATITGNERYFWIPARQMKQHQSRLTLRITDISVERLQDMSEEDAIAEGIIYEGGCEIPRKTFEWDWNSTHKKPSEKFEANCWVWKISYEVVK